MSTIWPNKWSSQLSSQLYVLKKISSQLSSQLCDQKNFPSWLSGQLFDFKNIKFLSMIVIFWLILVDYGKNWPFMVKYGQSKILLVHLGYFLVHLSVFWVKLWLIICQFLGNCGKNFSLVPKNCFLKSIIYSIVIGSQMSRQLFTQIFLEVKYQGNYFLNYYLKLCSWVRFWVESRSKPRLQGRGSVEGLDSDL